MIGKFVFCFIFISFFVTINTFAAAKTWVGGTSTSWKLAANWDNGIPTASDTAIFAGTPTRNCEIDSNISVHKIRITSDFTGTVTQNATRTITIGSGGYSQAGGTFTGSSTASDSIKLNGDFLLTDGTFTSTRGYFVISGIANQNNSGNFTVNGGSFVHNNGTVKFNHDPGGYGHISTISIGLASNKLEMGSLWFHNNTTDNHFNNYVISAGDTLVANGPYRQTGTSNNNGCRVKTGVIEIRDSICTAQNGTTTVEKTGGNAILLVNGTGNQYYQSTGGQVPKLEINKSDTLFAASGTTDFTSADFTLTSGVFSAPTGNYTVTGILTDNSDNNGIDNTGNFAINGGTFLHNNGTLRFMRRPGGYGHNSSISTTDPSNKITLGSLIVYNNSNNNWWCNYNIESGDTLLVTGNYTQNGVTGYAYGCKINTGVVEVRGNITFAERQDGGSASFLISGSNAQTITHTNSLAIPNGGWTINKSSGSVVLGSNISFPGGITITSGTLDQGASYGLKTGGTITVGASGAWTNTGTGYDSLGGAVVNSGTITIDGATTACDLDSKISLFSTSGEQRAWSGGGSFTISDALVKGMSGSITANNSVNMGNNSGWTINDGCGDGTKHYWIATANGNWNTASNWWPAFVPASTDTAVFTWYSTFNCAIDVNASVKRLEIRSNYSGTITQNATRTLTIGRGGFSQAGGVFLGSNAAIVDSGNFVMTGGSFTSTSSIFTMYGSRYIELNPSFTISGGTFSHNDGTLYFFGLAGKSGVGTNATVNWTVDVTSKLALKHLHLVGQGGDGDGEVVNVNIGSGDTISVAGNLVFKGTSGALEYLYLNTGVVEFTGDTIFCDTGVTGGTGEILINGTASPRYAFTGGYLPILKLNTSGTVTPTSTTTRIGVNKFSLVSGTFSAPAILAIHDSGTAFSVQGGTFTHNNGLVKFVVRAGYSWDGLSKSMTVTLDVASKLTVGNLRYQPDGGGGGSDNVTFVIASGDTILVSGDFSVNRESSRLEALKVNGGVLEVYGNFTDSFSTATSTASVLFSGSKERQTVSVASGQSMPTGNWEIKKSYGTVVQGSNLTFPGKLRITSGAFSQGRSTYTLSVTDSLIIGTNGRLVNQGSGSLTLGSFFLNDGVMNYNGAGHLGGDANISIEATAPRTWTGSGLFFLNDVSLTNQNNSTGTIYAYSSAIVSAGTGFDVSRNDTVSYSIGTNSAVLHNTGTVTASPRSATLNFSGSTIPTTGTGAIGEGDRIILDPTGAAGGPDTCYVQTVNSATQITLQIPPTCSLYNAGYEIKRSYNTLQTWENARDNDLVTEKVVEKGVCFADGNFSTAYGTSVINIAGATTGSSNFMWLTVAQGQRHNGVEEGVNIVYNGGASTVNVSTAYSRVEYLRVSGYSGYTSTTARGISVTHSNCFINACIIHDIASTSSFGGLLAFWCSPDASPNGVIFSNCLAYNLSSSTGDRRVIAFGDHNRNTQFINCTAYNISVSDVTSSAFGFKNNGTTATFKNCLSVKVYAANADSGICFSGGAAASNYNLSSDATAPGANSLINKLAYNQFVDTTSASVDLHLRGSADAKNAGDSTGLLQYFDTDIDGVVRTGVWDIGADEYIFSGPAFTWIGEGADSNWNTGANWSGGVVPTTTDTARFNDATNNPCFINANASVRGLILESTWSGTITQNATRTITIGVGGYIQNGGTFTGGNSKISVTGTANEITTPFILSGGTFTSTSDTLEISATALRFTGGTFNHANGYFHNRMTSIRTDSLFADSSFHFNHLVIGSFARNTYVSGKINVQGNLYINGIDAIVGDTILVHRDVVSKQASNGGTSGACKLIFRGSNNQSLSADGGYGWLGATVIVQKSGGTLTVTDTIGSAYDWICDSGNVSFGATNLVKVTGNVNGDYKIKSGGHSFNSLWITQRHGWLFDTVTVLKDLRLSNSATSIVRDSNYAFKVGGNLTSSKRYYSSANTVIILNGTGLQAVTAADSTNYSFLPCSLIIDKPSGKVVLARSLYLNDALTIRSGHLSMGDTSSLRIDGALTIGANGILSGRGSGDLKLGGALSNSGVLHLNGYGHLGGDANAIEIRSTVDGTPRTWTGSGQFFLYDVLVKNMENSSLTNPIYLYSSTDSTGNTNFNFSRDDTVSYSIGTNTGVLHNAGTVITSPRSATLNFSGSTIPTTGTGAIGEGDRIILDPTGAAGGPDTCYVQTVNSATQITLQIPPICSLYNGDYEIKRSYNTLQAWEDARDNDLVTQKVVEKGVCFADGNLAAVTVSGATVDASHFMWIIAAPGQRHNGTGSGGGVQIAPANLFSANYTKLEWVRISGSGSFNYGLRANGSYTTVANCIVHDIPSTGTWMYALWLNNSYSKAMNCIVYNVSVAGANLSGFRNGDGAGFGSTSFYNCTAYKLSSTGTPVGFVRGYPAINCIAMSCGTDFSDCDVASDYNLSSDLTAPGTHSIRGESAYNHFVDTTSGTINLHLSDKSSAIDAGFDLSGIFTDDIDGNIRAYTWDIGADEFSGVINYLSIVPNASDTHSINYSVTRLCDLSSSDINAAYIFTGTDSTNISNNFQSIVAADTLLRTDGEFTTPNCTNSKTIISLANGIKYYLGVATRNTTNAWSNSVKIASYWTKPGNALTISISETPALGDSGLICTIKNINKLTTSDTIQVFIGINAPKNTTLGPDTAFTFTDFSGKDSITFIRKGMLGSTKYFFTVRNGVSANINDDTRWSEINSVELPGNWDTLTTPDYSPATTPSIQIVSVSTSEANFRVPSSTSYNSVSDSVLFFVATDSSILAQNWKTTTPNIKTDTAGSRATMSVDTLSDGKTYWIGVAAISKEGIWSQSLSMSRITTITDNKLTITVSKIDNSTFRLKIDGIQALSSTATTVKLWNRKIAQLDSSIDGDSIFSISYPFASDTISRIVTYPAFTSDTFYFSITAGYSGNWASISTANRAQVYVDNTKPINNMVILVLDSTNTSISDSISGATLPSETDVDSIWIYLSTDSTSLWNTFLSRGAPYIAFDKSLNSTRQFTSLSQATRYWIGAATRDRMGNWCDDFSVTSRYTKPTNPLALTISESGTLSQLRITINGLNLLDTSLVDSVLIYYDTIPLSGNSWELKGTYWLKGLLLGDSSVLRTGFASEKRYYFAVTERVPRPGVVLYGDMAATNRTTFITGDYIEPNNGIVHITDSTETSLSYTINTGTMSNDVKDVYIFYGTNAATLASTYKTATPHLTLTKSAAMSAGTLIIGSLTQATRYFVGIAVKDSAGNWSPSLHLDSARTKVKNPLGISLSKRINNNRLIAIAFSNLDSLSPKIDSIRVWWAENTVRFNPETQTLQAIRAPDTIIARSLMSDTVIVTLRDSIAQRFCFSAIPTLYEFGNTWAAPTTNAAMDTIFYDSDEPLNPITLNLLDTSLTSITIRPTGTLVFTNTDVESLYIWVRKVGSIDSIDIATQFRLLPPDRSVSIARLNDGTITSLLFASLDTGSHYYFAVAPKDTSGNYSIYANVRTFKSGSRPLNPLTLTATAVYSNFARITISNLSQLATNINRSLVKVLLSTSTFNTNASDTSGARYFNLTDSAANTASIIVSGLTQLTTYYLTVSVSNARGWNSSITLPTNSCQFSTPSASDTIPPNGTLLTLKVDTSKLQPLTQVAFTVARVNSITVPDRDSAVLRVCWSPNAPNMNFAAPPAGVSYMDIPLSDISGDTLKDELIYPLMPASIKRGTGKPYYVTIALRDAAYNWDIGHIKSGVGYTLVDTVRPTNDTTWSVSRVGFSDLRVAWNPLFFNRPPLSFRDTVPRIGIWIRSDSFPQLFVDTAAPSITMDSGSGSPRSFPVLSHNRSYFVACAPMNTIDNRGRVVWNKSMFRINVPFDSSTIMPPPNLCTLTVAYTTIPETLKVRWRLPSIQYTDANNNIPVQLASVMIRYRTDGIYPSTPEDGMLAGIYPLNPSLSDSTLIGSLPTGSEIRFTAFVINQLSSSYPNRISASAPQATASIRTLSYPANHLTINSLITHGGGANPVTISVRWNIASGSLPTAVRFLVRTPAIVPTAHTEQGYIVFTPPTISYNELQSDLPDTLLFGAKYIVAAFVRNGDGVWSKEVAWDTITTPAGLDVTPPVSLPFSLSAKVIDCKNVRIIWSIDSATLANAKTNENNKLSFIYGYSTSGSDSFLNPTNIRPYTNPAYRLINYNHVDSIVISGLIPNRTYTFAVSVVDSANNQAITDSVSVTEIALFVPPIPDSSIELSLIDDMNYLINWSKNIDSATSRLWLPDTNIKRLTLAIQKDSAYTGTLPLLDETGDRLIRALDVSTKIFSENRFNWDRNNYYLTLWPTVDRVSGIAGPPTVMGPFRYIIDQPFLDSIRMIQILDTIVRISFIPRDSTENIIRLGPVSYGVNKIPDRIVPKTAYDTTKINLNIDTIPINQRCSVDIHLNRLDQTEWALISGKNSSSLSFKIDISDMRPILKATPDTSYLCSLIIDNKGPSLNGILINYSRSTRTMSVRLAADSIEGLHTVVWGLSPSIIVDTIAYIIGDTITIDTTGINGIFIRLIDKLGNTRDTIWNDFLSSRLPFSTLYKTTTSFDNGGISVFVADNAIGNNAFSSGYLTIGLQSLPNNIPQLTAMGFSNAQPERYVVISERVNTDGGTVYYRNGIDIGIKTTVLDTGLKVFRLFSNGTLQSIGGELDIATSVLWIRKYSPESIWNSYAQGSPSSADSFVLIVAKDNRPPVIDTITSGIVLNAVTDSAKVIIKAMDNTVRMRASWKVFTFRPDISDVPVVLWDTTTSALTSGTRGKPATVADTSVLCEFDITAIYRANKQLCRKNGLFLAVWISDNTKRYLFHSFPIAVDSVTGSFNSLNEFWSIININAKPNSNLSIFECLSGLSNGSYDPGRIKIFALSNNEWRPYAKDDPLFRIAPNNSFLMITRKSADNTILFNTGKATLPSVKNSRGFAMAAGGTSGGWRMTSLPYMGSISQASIISASITKDTATGRVPLINRLWRLDRNEFKVWNSNSILASNVKLHSAKGYGDGLLAFLYPGEELIAPFLNDITFIAAPKSIQSKYDAKWETSVTITAYDNNGNKTMANSFLSLGVAENPMTLPALKAPGQMFSAGFSEQDGLASVSRKSAAQLGWIWTFSVKTASISEKTMQLTLPNITSIPEHLSIVIDYPSNGFNTDLRANSGTLPFESVAGQEQLFRIVVGDSLFISKNVKSPKTPNNYELSQNAPNPFNPVTKISFEMPNLLSGSRLAKSSTFLTIIDIRGRTVKTLFNKVAQAGYYSVTWDGKNENGAMAASGIYLYQLIVRDDVGRIRCNKTKKMVLLK